MRSPWKRWAHIIGARSHDRPLDRASGEVLARVAHEARQPLSAARAAFELIRQAPAGPRRERACIVIDRQLVRLARLFDDLTEASRVGKTMLQMQQIDLRRLVDEVVEGVRPHVIEKHQHISVHLPAEAVWLDGDPARLQQVVSNLLVNGIKYTGSNGRVAVDLAHGSGDAVLTVDDTGRGIGADVLPHIFEPFVRGHDTPGDGLGIGLTIARQFVELHGGTIRASSRGPGCGSTFVVTLPARRPRYRDALVRTLASTPLAPTGRQER